jgi:glycosyltransferase involved in cell wall biosynthesis
VFVMGPSTRDFLTARGFPEDQVTVTGSGPNASIPPLRIRSTPIPRRLLFIGKSWERKGGPALVAAAERCAAAHGLPLTVEVVGCTPAVQNPSFAVRGVIPADELGRVFDQADLFAMPTRSEAFGIVFIEALCSGLPVVGSTVDNVPWIVGDAGECPDPTDEDAVFGALSRLVTDFPKYARLAAERGTIMRGEWTWRNIAESILQRGELTG